MMFGDVERDARNARKLVPTERRTPHNGTISFTLAGEDIHPETGSDFQIKLELLSPQLPLSCRPNQHQRHLHISKTQRIEIVGHLILWRFRMTAFHGEIQFQLQLQPACWVDGMVDEKTCSSAELVESRQIITRNLRGRESDPHTTIKLRKRIFLLLRMQPNR